MSLDVPHIADRAAFSQFLDQLCAEAQHSHADWENSTLQRYLEALTAWIRDSAADGSSGECAEHGDWTLLARALSAARYYE